MPSDLDCVNRSASLIRFRSESTEIVHTLLLKEYGVSKKWVIIIDRRQDPNTASTPEDTGGPSAQDRYLLIDDCLYYL